MNRDGFRYWAWYGLNNGRGVGLARSNDLVHWTKYEHNPLWLNARWPSVLQGADPAHPGHADFRDHARLRHGEQPHRARDLERRAAAHRGQEPRGAGQHERNQNPNLFRDPVSGRYFLTWYRGNDNDYFDIVSRNAARVDALDRAPEELLLHIARDGGRAKPAVPAARRTRRPGHLLPGHRGVPQSVRRRATAASGRSRCSMPTSRTGVRAGRGQSGRDRRARLPVPARLRTALSTATSAVSTMRRSYGRWKCSSCRCPNEAADDLPGIGT